MNFFCLLTYSFFFHLLAFDLRLSGWMFDGFFLFFDLQILFPFFWLWLKAIWFRLWWILFVFRLAASFPIFLRFVRGRRVWALTDFFCFLTCTFFFYFIVFGLKQSGSGFDWFFLFFDLQLLLPFYRVWFKEVGFRLWRIFFVFRLAASFPILLALV